MVPGIDTIPEETRGGGSKQHSKAKAQANSHSNVHAAEKNMRNMQPHAPHPMHPYSMPMPIPERYEASQGRSGSPMEDSGMNTAMSDHIPMPMPGYGMSRSLPPQNYYPSLPWCGGYFPPYPYPVPQVNSKLFRPVASHATPPSHGAHEQPSRHFSELLQTLNTSRKTEQADEMMMDVTPVPAMFGNHRHMPMKPKTVHASPTDERRISGFSGTFTNSSSHSHVPTSLVAC
eukprot:scaffold412_cov388-Prasinococcus_capsulatus_cf.AAC.3